MTPGPDTSIQDTPTGTGTGRQQFVFLSGTAFDSVIGGRTRRLADVLSRQGHRVVFVELPSVRGAIHPLLRFGTRLAADGSIRVIRLCPLPAYVRLCRTAIARRWETYAARRLSDDSPYGWRLFLVNQREFQRLCSYGIIREMMGHEGRKPQPDRIKIGPREQKWPK